MGYWNIAVIAHPESESDAGEVGAYLTKTWNSHPPELFKVSSLGELVSSSLDELDAVVLVVNGLTKSTDLLRPLTRLEEHHVPVLALLDQSPDAHGVFEHAAVLVESRSTPGAVLCARLHGMLHRQREINELHVPIGSPVKLIMTSDDVIHSFYVPAFRMKMDVLPGRYTTAWFEATKPGEYHLFCTEYCGTKHSEMIGKVKV